MIEGHGDDAYRYTDIKSDFSSNICASKSHEALMAHLASRPELLSHYPEPEAWSLERILAERHDISPECVIVTSGATEAIYLVAQAFSWMRPVIPAPTFREYEDAYKVVGSASERCVQVVGNASERYVQVVGNVSERCNPDDKSTDCHAWKRDPITSSNDATLGGVNHYGKSILWLCNPNNPTGELYTTESIDTMAAAHTITVIDQSYEHYTDLPTMSAKEAVSRANIIQIHSMTKTYAVPGLRLGYIVAAKPLTAALRHRLHPWSVSALAIEAGKYLLQHYELRCKPELKEAQRLRQQLMTLGIDVQHTHTNFMLCRLPAAVVGSPVVGNASERCSNPYNVTLGGVTHYEDATLGGVTHYEDATLGGVAHYSAAELKDYLAREHKMLIRDASNFRGLTPYHFRVAAQTPAENDALVAAIKKFKSAFFRHDL